MILQFGDNLRDLYLNWHKYLNSGTVYVLQYYFSSLPAKLRLVEAFLAKPGDLKHTARSHRVSFA